MCIPHANRRDFLRTAAAASCGHGPSDARRPHRRPRAGTHRRRHREGRAHRRPGLRRRPAHRAAHRRHRERTDRAERPRGASDRLRGRHPAARPDRCPHPPPGRHHPAAAGRLGRRDGASDMACFPPSLVDSLRRRPGSTDIRSAGHRRRGTRQPAEPDPRLPGERGPDRSRPGARLRPRRIGEGSTTSRSSSTARSLPATVKRRHRGAHSFGRLVMAHATSALTVGRALDAACAHDPSRSARQPALRRDGSALRRHGLRSPSPP